jgi:signal peptidase II
MRRPRKVFWMMLFAVFFILLHFWLRSWIIGLENFTTICNYGWLFGINVTSPKWFSLIGFGIGVLLIAEWWKKESLAQEWPWILIISGGLGNLLERLSFGCIMDYIALPFFPVFNIADILLTIGVIGILIKNVKK